MSVTQVIDALRREQRELDQQIKSLSDRKTKIDTAISVLEGMGDKLIDPTRSDADDQAVLQEVSSRADAQATEPRHSRDDGPQATLRRLMRARPGEEIDSKTAHDLLLSDGWQSASQDPINVVRTALATMAGRGELVKRGRGKYAFEPKDEDDADPVIEQTVVPGTLDLIESDYGSGSYSRGTALSDGEEMAENPRRAHDPFAPRRVPVQKGEQVPSA